MLPILAIYLVMMKPANAPVDPDASMVIVASRYVQDVTGNTFKVNITLVNVNAMWGWSCVINWNSAIVNCTNVELGPFNPNGAFANYVIDNAGGKIAKLAVGTTATDTETGSGVAGILTFKTKGLGSVNLNVSGANYKDYPGMVKYDLPVTQAPIDVVPEFPTLLIIPLFLITTVAIAIMTKKRWMKKY